MVNIISEEVNPFDEWNELSNDYKQLETTNKMYQEKMEELSNLQKSCQKHITHQRYRIGIICKNLAKLKKYEDSNKKMIEELENNIAKRNAQLNEIEQTLPRQNGLYLKIILGNVNVSILNKEEKFKYKDEYEKFKLVLSIIAFIISVMNLFTRIRSLELSFLFLLVWYYCTLTIRESILKINGSRIKGWWRFHHFLSTAASGILLIWPDNETWNLFRNQFIFFNCYISCVQYLQFRYQRGVLYRLKALGERYNMDITIEGFHSWMWRGLSFLLPFLFFGYFFQLFNAYTLYKLSQMPSATWHVLVLSIMFFILFLGNVITTLMVIPIKLKESQILYKIKSNFKSEVQGVINDKENVQGQSTVDKKNSNEIRQVQKGSDKKD